MNVEPLPSSAAQEWTANDLIEDAVAWRDRLAEWVQGVTDGRELALVIIELEDLLAHELQCLGEAKRKVLRLNA